MIVGSGSLSFEIIRYLTERLPVMICPRWLYTRVQPIAGVIARLAGNFPYPLGELGRRPHRLMRRLEPLPSAEAAYGPFPSDA